jgi:hypothetical protein
LDLGGNQLVRHTEQFKKYYPGDDLTSQKQPKSVEKEQSFEVEKIVDSRVDPASGERYYRVRWTGYDESDDTWEPISNFDKLQLVTKYHRENQIPISSIFSDPGMLGCR